MMQQVRTRYAPSPTGYPHVGNIRTALFAWLYARRNDGVFILRIEDTDAERSVEGSLENILESMRWLGLDWDEGPGAGGNYGPYVQSERLHLYQDAAHRLVESGHAYYCYCSAERLEKLREEQIKRKLPLGYDRCCRNLTAEQRKAKEADGIKPVVRFKSPTTGQTKFHDEIWGDVTFENSNVEDLVLLKSDGYPTYHLANVVDDHAMGISHVIRAEEYISSTPMHLMTYEALGYIPPKFAHVPMVLGNDRAKLSKRHGATSVLEFREQGYLSDALLNFLALVGWSLDDKTDIISREELIKNFSLERVGKTAAIFNHEKLKWMNGVYIRKLTDDDLAGRVFPFMENDLPSQIKRPLDIDYVREIVPLIRERIFTLKEAAPYADFFFLDELEYDSAMLIGKNMTAETVSGALKAAGEKLASLENFNKELLEDNLRQLAGELGMKAGQLFNPLRVATTARDAAPPLFETMEVLGKERCLKRIKAALAKLAGN
ncbi:MAG: glutamate--tRNA ligase [Dehalococcoidales bacterium]|nr:glutamate--tRNA ligase [Dehalococcoidales bacterium]